jgi:predicted enzyme related to lactoylglutathione lyase
MKTLSFSVEVITIPVSDVERALRFYADQVGFTIDVDYSPNDAFPCRATHSARIALFAPDR